MWIWPYTCTRKLSWFHLRMQRGKANIWEAQRVEPQRQELDISGQVLLFPRKEEQRDLSARKISGWPNRMLHRWIMMRAQAAQWKGQWGELKPASIALNSTRLINALLSIGKMKFYSVNHTFLPHRAKAMRPPSSSPAGMLLMALIRSPAHAHNTRGLMDIAWPSLRTSPRIDLAVHEGQRRIKVCY